MLAVTKSTEPFLWSVYKHVCGASAGQTAVWASRWTITGLPQAAGAGQPTDRQAYSQH